MTREFTPPRTRYTESGGLSIAYQVFGSGTQDLVVVPGIVSHLEENWRDDGYVAVMRRLVQSFRVILFDKLGQGMSDSFDGGPVWHDGTVHAGAGLSLDANPGPHAGSSWQELGNTPDPARLRPQPGG